MQPASAIAVAGKLLRQLPTDPFKLATGRQADIGRDVYPPSLSLELITGFEDPPDHGDTYCEEDRDHCD